MGSLSQEHRPAHPQAAASPPPPAFSQGCPGTAPVPTRPPYARRTPRGKRHARPLLHEVGWAGSITRGGEQGRFGGGRKAGLGLSCLKLPPGICKVSLQGERSDGSRCKTCQASKIFQPAQAESWLSFQRASANS